MAIFLLQACSVGAGIAMALGVLNMFAGKYATAGWIATGFIGFAVLAISSGVRWILEMQVWAVERQEAENTRRQAEADGHAATPGEIR